MSEAKWGISDERGYLETVLSQRFNFLLVFVSLIITAAATVPSRDARFFVLGFGTVISAFLSLTLFRVQWKLDIAFALWNREDKVNAAARITAVANQARCWLLRISMRPLIGYVIPPIIVFSLLSATVWAFARSDLSFQHQQDSIMSGYDTLMSGGFGLLGVAIGTFASWHLGKRRDRTANTFILHREFFSAEMNQVRYSAGKFVKDHPDAKLDEIYRLYATEATSLWTLMEFYRRLLIAINHNQVDNSLVSELFGSMFVWWDTFFFEKALSDLRDGEWDECEYLPAFRVWLRKNTNTTDYEKWTDRASLQLGSPRSQTVGGPPP